MASSGIPCRPDRTRHARTSSNNSGTVDKYGNVADPSRCSEHWCSNRCRLVNLSQKGRANGSHRLQGIGNTQIVRPAGGPRISHVDGCDRTPCSPDRQFSSGGAPTLTLVSLITESNPSPRLRSRGQQDRGRTGRGQPAHRAGCVRRARRAFPHVLQQPAPQSSGAAHPDQHHPCPAVPAARRLKSLLSV